MVLVRIQALLVKKKHLCLRSLVLAWLICLCVQTLSAFGASRRVPLSLKPDDVFSTGNEWIALPGTRSLPVAASKNSSTHCDEEGRSEGKQAAPRGP